MVSTVIKGIALNPINNGEVMATVGEYESVHYLIDDDFIDKDYTFEIILPLWDVVNSGEGRNAYIESCKGFSREQIHLCAIWLYFSEVLNGGHIQYYLNDYSIVTQDAVEGFRAMGLDSFADVLEESYRRLEIELSPDIETRRKQLDQLEQMGNLDFDDLDTKFGELESANLFDKAMLAYINSNRQAFYFDGYIPGKKR